MNRFDHQWQKLTALARQVPDERSAAAPYGFATRVSARAAALPAFNNWAFFERFALRGLMIAAGLCMAAVAADYALGQSDHEDELGMTDSVSELMNIS